MPVRTRLRLLAAVLGCAVAAICGSPRAAAQTDVRAQYRNQPIDIAPDFRDPRNLLFAADRLSGFDPATGAGTVTWQRERWGEGYAFNNAVPNLANVQGNEFPSGVYAVNPSLPFRIDFVSDRTVRIRMATKTELSTPSEDLMLAGPVGHSDAWKPTQIRGGWRYDGPAGSVTVLERPWRVEFRDTAGRLLTRTFNPADNASYVPIVPFSFVRRTSDGSQSVDAVLSLQPGERIYGCGESFGPLNKVGQKVVLYTTDANGVDTGMMYKPVPFFLSSRGYGVFMHTSTPVTCDFGATFDGATSLAIGDDQLDLFVFIGTPREVLGAYTDVTGKSPMPPLWSFGLWMSRITYNAEQQVRDVAARLRADKIPADVIHLDTGWFENDWESDYQFSKTRFADPEKMVKDLLADGFHISLWQLPYFIPRNRLFPEIVRQGLFVHDGKGNLPAEDAILDFTNPATVKWYQAHLAKLLKMGVGAIKVDFGEAAPPYGVYANGRTGFYEHNLYPLRYNKAVADVTREVTGENIIWARSAWAGSQRYPLHWGGDAASDDGGMAAELRGGLSFGLSGFAFWSHDIGGFTRRPSTDLYARWLPFGLLSSHSRTHGQPPREPWEYGKEFEDGFRRADNMRYELMPYIYAQAKDCSERGLPMVRALFVDYPDDPGAWRVDDEYLFGNDILVAPMIHGGATERAVYLPGTGQWIDYQTGKDYGPGWQTIAPGAIPVVMLVRDGAAIPRIALAQSTKDMDWSKLTLQIFADEAKEATGLVCLPSDQKLHEIKLTGGGEGFKLVADPLDGKVSWSLEVGAKQ